MSKTSIELGELMNLISLAYELQDNANKIVKELENIVKRINNDDWYH